MPDASHLMLVLAGQRFRIGAQHWVVQQTVVEPGRLRLELTGTTTVTLEVELPDSFDSRSGEHMAWLIGRIEAQLKDPDK
jgi:hypothetical protein